MIDEVNPSEPGEETSPQSNLASEVESGVPTEVASLPQPSAESKSADGADVSSDLGGDADANIVGDTPSLEAATEAEIDTVIPSTVEASETPNPTAEIFVGAAESEQPPVPETVSAVEVTADGSAQIEPDTGSIDGVAGDDAAGSSAGEGVEDEDFIKEKASQVRAAKKKAAAPRVRAPRKTKEKLPDLGDGSGYEPPDPPVAAAEGLEPSEAQDDALWYAVHCYSGYENKVKHSLEQRIETMGMAGRIMEVVVPTEEEIEVRDGKRKTVERRVFPGYVIVRMRMSEDSWHVVRNTPGVTRFIGMGNRPQPLTPQEVNQILKRMEAEAPKIKVNFKTGQKVRITDGPFADLMGLVDRIDTEHAKVVVLVNFFGRDTPVELDFLQVEKM